jgi:hypothetical protein
MEGAEQTEGNGDSDRDSSGVGDGRESWANDDKRVVSR